MAGLVDQLFQSMQGAETRRAQQEVNHTHKFAARGTANRSATDHFCSAFPARAFQGLQRTVHEQVRTAQDR